MLVRCAALLVLATAPILAQEIFLSRIGDIWRYFPAVTEASSPGICLAGRLGLTIELGGWEVWIPCWIQVGEARFSPQAPSYVAVYFRKNFTSPNRRK